jgi:hypothetical protein
MQVRVQQRVRFSDETKPPAFTIPNQQGNLSIYGREALSKVRPAVALPVKPYNRRTPRFVGLGLSYARSGSLNRLSCFRQPCNVGLN